jgi:hypothetical protein
MSRLSIVTATTMALVLAGLALPAGDALALTKEQIVGTWTLVSIYSERQDGSKFDTYGPNPKGIVIFDANGHYSLQIMSSSGRLKFASNDRTKGTPEENKSVAENTIAHFGTYSVDEGGLVLHLEGCSFPNWDGQTQKRSVNRTADELQWVNPNSAIPVTTAHLVWKQTK